MMTAQDRLELLLKVGVPAWMCLDCGAVCDLTGWPENGHHARLSGLIHKGTCVKVRVVPETLEGER